MIPTIAQLALAAPMGAYAAAGSRERFVDAENEGELAVTMMKLLSGIWWRRGI